MKKKSKDGKSTNNEKSESVLTHALYPLLLLFALRLGWSRACLFSTKAIHSCMKPTFRPLRPKGSKRSLAAIKDAYMARRAMHNDMGVQCSVKPRSLLADPIRIQTKNTARHMCLLVTLTFRLAVQRCSAHYAVQQCLLSRSDSHSGLGACFP